MAGTTSTLLRARNSHDHARVTNIELFFDLVFVFAVTQLSHSVLHDLSLHGIAHASLLFLGVWWVWIYTSWVTNWLDPERNAVRVLLLALMLAGLVLSASIPDAFEARGLSFAAAYAGIQVGRSLFMLWALKDDQAANRRNFQRITCWLALTGTLWIAGALVAGDARVLVWALALAIEYAGPSLGFRVPGLGRSTTADWNIEGGHFAERCSLFIIIALGESVLVTGASFAETQWDLVAIASFAVSFAGSIAMWWIYFDTGIERGVRKITRSGDPGRVARLAYTYLHLPIVGGIIAAAVGNELVVTHPLATAEPLEQAAIFTGPAIYLLGNLMFKRAISGRWPLSHLIGIVLLALTAAVLAALSNLAIAAICDTILIVVAAWEAISLRRGADAAEVTPP